MHNERIYLEISFNYLLLKIKFRNLDVAKIYGKNNMVHRLNGPAYIFSNGDHFFYLNGICIDFEPVILPSAVKEYNFSLEKLFLTYLTKHDDLSEWI